MRFGVIGDDWNEFSIFAVEEDLIMCGLIIRGDLGYTETNPCVWTTGVLLAGLGFGTLIFSWLVDYNLLLNFFITNSSIGISLAFLFTRTYRSALSLKGFDKLTFEIPRPTFCILDSSQVRPSFKSYSL
jgi:hypothetical protein